MAYWLLKTEPGEFSFAVEPLHRLARPVTLAEIKADPASAGFELVRMPRLSVLPVPPTLWRRLLTKAG